MATEKYNGWTNYETWRINLEIFNDWHQEEDSDEDIDEEDIAVKAASLKSQVEDLIQGSSEKGIARSYAMAFISDVNWQEIARHYLPETEEEKAQ